MNPKIYFTYLSKNDSIFSLFLFNRETFLLVEIKLKFRFKYF